MVDFNMLFKKKNKRGSVIEPITNSAYLLALVMTIIIALYVWFSFSDTFSLSIAGSSSEALLTPILQDLTNIYISMDYVVPVLVIGLVILSSILAYKSGANVFLAIMAFIVWLLAMLFSATFTNVYLQFKDNFSTVVTHTPFIDLIFTNLKWIVLGWLAIITFLTFRKDNKEDDATAAQRAYQGA